MLYCARISSDEIFLKSSDIFKTYKDAMTILCEMYFATSEENRTFVIQTLKKHLKSPLSNVSQLAFTCVRTIHSMWKEQNSEVRTTFYMFKF